MSIHLLYMTGSLKNLNRRSGKKHTQKHQNVKRVEYHVSFPVRLSLKNIRQYPNRSVNIKFHYFHTFKLNDVLCVQLPLIRESFEAMPCFVLTMSTFN